MACTQRAIFLLGLAIIPLFSPNATVACKPVHVAELAPIAATFIAILVGAALDRYYGNDLRQTLYLRFQAALVAGLSAGLLYAAVVGVVVYLRAQHVAIANRWLASEKQQSEVSRQLVETRLRVLQAQIEPHFLFNTLGSAQQLAQKGAPDAAILIGHLVRFLRTSIPSMRDDTAPLKHEFGQLVAYLAIMQTRTGDRLSFSVTAAPYVEAFTLPPALVMTLMEHAIKHGIEPAENGGRIDVKAALAQGNLVIAVTDTGVGLSELENKEHGIGIGLSNIAQRQAGGMDGQGRREPWLHQIGQPGRVLHPA